MSVSTSTTSDPSWAGRRPTTSRQWVARAEAVATQLSVDALERDRANRTPYAEVQLLKESGLVPLLGPAEQGGAGENWTTALRAVRAVSAGDASIGQLLGYHYLWWWAVRLVGTPEQIAAVEQQAVENTWFFGGAVNPRDSDLVITEVDGEFSFNGRKTFSTGGRVSDVTVLEGVIEGTDKHVLVAVAAEVDGKPVGLAASSFTSVSLDPPLVSFSIANTSKTWPDLRRAKHLGVTILADHHGQVCRQLAGPVDQRFEGVLASVSDDQAVTLDDGLARFECSIHQEVEAGDHTIVLLRLQAVDAGADPVPGSPLVFHRSAFGRMAAS